MDELQTLQERIEQAEIARDNALQMKEEALSIAREKTRRAGEEIAKIREERNRVLDALQVSCRALATILCARDFDNETRACATEALKRASHTLADYFFVRTEDREAD